MRVDRAPPAAHPPLRHQARGEDLRRGPRARGAGGEAGAPRPHTDWLEHWLRTEGVAWGPVTRHERAERIDKLIVPHLGSLRLAEISRSEVRSWRAALVRDGASLYTADRAVQILSAALGAAVRDDLIRDNPCRGLGRIYRPVQRRRAAQPLEVELIRAQMRFPRDRVMASLMAYAGLRPAALTDVPYPTPARRRTIDGLRDPLAVCARGLGFHRGRPRIQVRHVHDQGADRRMCGCS